MKKAKNNDFKLNITQESNYYVMIPYNVAKAKNSQLSKGAKALYIYLKSNNENFNLSIESIAHYLEESASTINREIAELKQKGYLILTKKENAKTYNYVLSNSPKLDKIKDFSNENILNAFFNDTIDIKDIKSLYDKKYITNKQYNEILDKIFKIAKTEWLNDD